MTRKRNAISSIRPRGVASQAPAAHLLPASPAATFLKRRILRRARRREARRPRSPVRGCKGRRPMHETRRSPLTAPHDPAAPPQKPEGLISWDHCLVPWSVSHAPTVSDRTLGRRERLHLWAWKSLSPELTPTDVRSRKVCPKTHGRESWLTTSRCEAAVAASVAVTARGQEVPT